MFVIKPGIYHIPNFGKLDTRKTVTNAKSLELYKNPAFPFISITEEVIPFLKKEKLSEKTLVNLIKQAQSAEEVAILVQVKSTKKIKAAAALKTESFLY
jgi:hypothetical protein